MNWRGSWFSWAWSLGGFVARVPFPLQPAAAFWRCLARAAVRGNVHDPLVSSFPVWVLHSVNSGRVTLAKINRYCYTYIAYCYSWVNLRFPTKSLGFHSFLILLLLFLPLLLLFLPLLLPLPLISSGRLKFNFGANPIGGGFAPPTPIGPPLYIPSAPSDLLYENHYFI